jgi:type I restriction enzyme S subunit
LISPQYIYAFIRSPYIKEIIDNAKNSTNDNISMADISSFLIPLPPLNEQKRIVEALDNVVASIMRN